ncbi:MAG: PhoU family transcriptional regulator [Chlorobi bacterium NICIL-2]|nr:MAG: PhoU family transcriptional regulator [Chlorobi bacterium NICIL-2]
MVRRRELDEGLERLTGLLVAMAEHVENALGGAMEALETLDAGTARRIIEADPELNRMEEQIADTGVRIIATQQPVAKDLRRILAAFRMAADLERMGDLSVDIARTVLRLQGQTLIKPLADLPEMARIVRTMIRESIRAYAEENVDLALKMARDDDRVDALYSQILRELFTLAAADPGLTGQAMLLAFVGRYIERIADHATNIGESVVYLVAGIRSELNP